MSPNELEHQEEWGKLLGRKQFCNLNLMRRNEALSPCEKRAIGGMSQTDAKEATRVWNETREKSVRSWDFFQLESEM